VLIGPDVNSQFYPGANQHTKLARSYPAWLTGWWLMVAAIRLRGMGSTHQMVIGK
jgi:hypothetical protein